MKVLILGHKGMLGHMVVKYLQLKNINVQVIEERWPSSQKTIKTFDGDFIINCIGAIPQRTTRFDINWQLPIWLDLNAPCRVIHPGTDCEMDDDIYGITKNIAGEYIRTLSKQTKSIKTSIIGPELSGDASLLEWSKQCYRLMNEWTSANKETIVSSQPVSKFELLHIIKDVFDKEIIINKKELGSNKCLEGIIHTGTIEKQLKELKEFYYD